MENKSLSYMKSIVLIEDILGGPCDDEIREKLDEMLNDFRKKLASELTNVTTSRQLAVERALNLSQGLGEPLRIDRK